MSQWLISPYWVSERRTRRDEADRLYQIDYKITELRVTNPTDEEGRFELVFYEARGDGNFYRSDWAGGIWSAPPKYQRYYRPDPSRVFGDSFFAYGWFEVWMSKNEMIIDVEISGISRSLIGGGTNPGAGGLVESISQRTINLISHPMPFLNRLSELLGRRTISPFNYLSESRNIITDLNNNATFQPPSPSMES